MVDAFPGCEPLGGGAVRSTRVAAEISGILELLRDEFLGGIEVSLSVPESAVVAAVHEASFRRIVLNLIINACEAMGSRGRLSIQADTVHTLAPGPVVLAPRGGPPWLRLRIIDTGPGIAPEAVARIFDAFFTTKPRDTRKRSGLGLYTVRTLAAEEGIGLRVTSELGSGTLFELLLPVGTS